MDGAAARRRTRQGPGEGASGGRRSRARGVPEGVVAGVAEGAGGDALRIAQYNAWANRRVFAHLRSLPSGTVEREISSVFPSVLEALRHVVVADLLLLDVMSGRSPEEMTARIPQVRGAVASADLGELESRFEDLAGRYNELLAEDGAAERPVVVAHPLGRLQTTVAELHRHVCNHDTYHRGNISAMLHQLGHRGVSTDYALFLMETRGTAR